MKTDNNAHNTKDLTEPRSNMSFANKQVFVWEWVDITELSPIEWRGRLKSLSMLGVTDVKINCESIVSSIEADYSKENKFKAIKKLESFSNEAAFLNIKVWASIGNPNWLQSSHAYLNEILIEVIRESENFEGVWLDHEFWNLVEFSQDPESIAIDFLTELESLSSKTNIKLGIAIPAWFDGSGELLPNKITWKGTRDNLFTHVVNALESKNNDRLINLMSYSKDSKRTVFSSKDELETLKRKGSKIKVTIGFETNNTIEDISYYKSDMQSLIEDTNSVLKELSKYRNYFGIAINDSDGLISLSRK